LSEEEYKKYREFLKSISFQKGAKFVSDQIKKIPPPPLEKPYPEDVPLIDLVDPQNFSIGNMSLIDVINKRRSRRKFTKEPFSLEEILLHGEPFLQEGLDIHLKPTYIFLLKEILNPDCIDI